MIDVKVNEQDLRTVIQKQAAEIAGKDLAIAALTRTIQEMEMAHAAEVGEESENGVVEHPGTEEVGTKPAPKRSNRSKASG